MRRCCKHPYTTAFVWTLTGALRRAAEVYEHDKFDVARETQCTNQRNQLYAWLITSTSCNSPFRRNSKMIVSRGSNIKACFHWDSEATQSRLFWVATHEMLWVGFILSYVPVCVGSSTLWVATYSRLPELSVGYKQSRRAVLHFLKASSTGQYLNILYLNALTEFFTL